MNHKLNETDILYTPFIYESGYRFKLRLEFIKKIEKLNYTQKEIIKLSKLWYNIKFNKCKYNKDIFTLMIKLDYTLKIS